MTTLPSTDLFNITLSTPDPSPSTHQNTTTHSQSPAKPTTPSESQPPAHDRTHQSQTSFNTIKETYTAKIEVGNLHTYLPSHFPTTKAQAQSILHAVEELYFHRKYSDAVRLVVDVLETDGGEVEVRFEETIASFRKTLEDYRGRCERKLGEGSM